MSDKLVSRSSSRRARKIISNDLSDLSPIKSKKNELTIGDNDYFNDANMDLSKFEKATEQRTKTQVEEERELVKKATRANERLLTKIHEASTKSTLKEAEYTMKLRDYEEKQMRLTAEVEKKEREISRTKEELRAQSDKTRQKISNRDTGYDMREDKKIANHNSLVQDLKQRIETARNFITDNDELNRLDNLVKQLQENIKTEELENRKKQEQIAEKNEELKAEKDTISQTKEKLKELEEGSIDLASVSREKKLLARESDQLEKELKELQAQKEVKDNDDDIWSLKGQLKTAKNDADDLISKRDRVELQLQRVKSGLTVEIGAASSVVASIKNKTYETKSPVVSTYTSPYGKTYGTTAVTGRGKKDEITREQATKIADLKKATREYGSRTGPKAEVLTNLEKANREQESVKAKAETLLKQTEEAQIGIEKLLAQQKAIFQAEILFANQKVELLVDINSKNGVQLAKVNKEMKDTLFEIGELQEQIKQTTALLNDAKSNLRTTEGNNKKKEVSNQRADRENQASLKQYRDLVDKLNETEDKKANAKQIIEETTVEFEETRRDFSSEVHTLEREIYDQTEKAEYLIQVVGELKKEVDDLKWYFKPHKQKEEKESRVYGTAEFDLIISKRKAVENEIKTLQTNLETVAVDHEWKRHMNDGDGLSGYFKASKKALEVYKNRSDVNQDNVDDMVVHVQILIRQLEKHYDADVALQAAILMINHNVYPGLQLYLANLVEKDHNTHILHRVPMFLRISYRNWMYDCQAKGPQHSDSFRKTLLQACIELRVKNQMVDLAYVNKFHQQVLGGEEMSRDEIETWLRDAAEFFIFFNKDGSREQIEAMVAGEEIPGIDDV